MSDTPDGFVEEWQALGTFHDLLGHRIFVVDAPAVRDLGSPSLLVLHGFPTSSIDFAAVLPALRARRRVVTFDMLGYGLSAKPDAPYSLFAQADLVEAVARALGLGEVDLLTHDMGDSVGGEILARSLDGSLGFGVRRRVLTNGSVYIDMAALSDGQKLLLSLPDEMLPEDGAPDAEALAAALRGTMSPGGEPDPAHLLATAELVVRDGGARLLPRKIRYVEERRRQEGRWTGAIERHPAPMTIVWGVDDPIAVLAIAEQLAARRTDAAFVRLAGVGHYPMIEDPGRFADEVLDALG